MQALDLSSNRIEYLLGESFIDQLGGRHNLQSKFPHIVSLNLSDNPIKDVTTLVQDLKLVMPGIKDL